MRTGKLLGLLAVGAGLSGCVRAARLGTTMDGHPQFSVSCARLASAAKCSAKAREVCGGEFETVSLGVGAPISSTNYYTGHQTTTPGGTVWVVACHRKDAPGLAVAAKAEPAPASMSRGEVLQCARKRRRNPRASCGT